MAENLVIRLPESADDAAEWVVVDDAGTRVGAGGRGPLSDAAAEQVQRRVIVLVPGTSAVEARATLPVRSASKMLQVAPFALEDQLAGDVTQMHFAIGKRAADGSVAVTAVSREHMSQWMATLEAAGIVAQQVLPDSAGVPLTEGGVTVMLLGEEAAVRDAAGNIAYVAHDSLLDMLTLLRAAPDAGDDSAGDGGEVPAGLDIFVDDSSGERGAALLAELQAAVPHARLRRLSNGLLTRMASTVLEQDAPNLLQGEFAPRGSLEKYWRPWRHAAGLAAALVVVALAARGAELLALQAEYEDLQAQMRDVYSAVLPAVQSPPPNLRADFERRLSPGPSIDSESDFLEGLAALAGALPAGSNTLVKLMNFNAGVLTLELVAPDIPTLDTLRANVGQSSPWEAQLIQTRPDDNVVEGRMQLRKSTP